MGGVYIGIKDIEFPVVLENAIQVTKMFVKKVHYFHPQISTTLVRNIIFLC